MSLREQIFATNDLEEQELYIPEWGIPIKLRTMTGAEREQFETWWDECQKNGTLRARVVATYCLDSEGNRIFEDGDVDRLNARSTEPLIRIFLAWKRLCLVGKEEVNGAEEK